jgi:hypothetical protein
MEMRGQFYALIVSLPEEQLLPPCLMSRRLCGPKRRSKRYEKEINLSPLSEIDPQVLGVQPIT